MLATVYDPRRWGQTMALAVAPMIWLLWPIASDRARRARAVAIWVWAMAFVVDAAVRGYLMARYQAAPNGSMVVASIANTGGQEIREYLELAWPALLPWILATSAAGIALAWALRREPAVPRAVGAAGVLPRPAPAMRHARIGLALGLLPLTAVAYAIKPWRRLHPAVFWPHWRDEIDAQRAGWADRERWRDEAFARARAEGARSGSDGAATVVLVLSDSVNRDNLSLYGYGRDTTPRLDALNEAMRDALVVFRDAWSAHAGTIPAVRSLFQFGATDPNDTAHLLALARVAGWRTWWISTHDDIAIEQSHARFADTVHMASRTPGRASRTPDSALLEPLRTALVDPAPRKLIVLHMMGGHPHYRLRYPAGDNPFDDAEDAVARDLERRGRPFWIRDARNHYDAALRHHDTVVARTFELLEAHRPRDGYAAWMFTSDHGQEVGHQIDHAGHSAATEAGYRIPLLVWQSRPRRPLPEDIETRPVRGDWGGWMLAHLLDLRWRGDVPQRDPLHDGYRWEPPPIPFSGDAQAGTFPGPGRPSRSAGG